MRDIPSSNFQKNAQQVKSQNKFASQFYQGMVSIPKNAQTVKNPDNVFANVAVPDKYKEFVQTQPTQTPKAPLKSSKVSEAPRPVQPDYLSNQPPSESAKPPVPSFQAPSIKAYDSEALTTREDQKILASQAMDVLKYMSKFNDKGNAKVKGKLFDPTLAKKPDKKVFEASAISIRKPTTLSSGQVYLQDSSRMELEEEDIKANQTELSEITQQKQSSKSASKRFIKSTGKQISLGSHSIDPSLFLSITYRSKVPDIEWWDLPFCKQTPQGMVELLPILTLPSYAANQALAPLPKLDPDNRMTSLKLLPTRDEQRKFKRKERLERQKQIQEKIKYGLLEAPPPKVKLSNFMQVLKTEATLNPTEIELQVRQQIEARQQKHIQHNQKNQLTRERKKEKLLRKAKKDSAKEIRLTVMLAKRLTNYEHQTIITKNVKQYYANGFMLVPTGAAIDLPAVIVTENGPRGSAKLKNLILNRIKWQHNKDSPAGTSQSKARFSSLLWEGTLPEHKMKAWKVIKVNKESEYISTLKSHGLDNFVNLILNFSFDS